MINYGLKIWSSNGFLFADSANLIRSGQADFIEIYIVPDSIKISELAPFKGLATSIHAPHYGHEFNIFSLSQEEVEMFREQTIRAADFLDSKQIIVHAGVGTDEKIFRQGLRKIFDSRILIENKPKLAVNDKLCFGYSFDQLTFIKNKCGLGICFDLPHAIKAAFSQKLDYKIFLARLIKHFRPSYFHISGATVVGDKDFHLNLWEGDIDIKWIKDKLDESSRARDISLVFEVPKQGRNLNNDLKNIEYFKKL